MNPAANRLQRSEVKHMQRIADSFLQTLMSRVSLAGTRILEIGCGEGYYSKQLAAMCSELVGVDPKESALMVAKKLAIENVQFVCCGAEALPFPPQSFDRMIYTLSWHHVPPELMQEALRQTVLVCKPGGIVIVFEPTEAGTLYEAEIEFNAWDGDEREAKRHARKVLLADKTLRHLGTAHDETVFAFRSAKDFIWSLEPDEDKRHLIEAFLSRQPRAGLRRGRTLNAKREIHIFELA
jgi:ubiquinone/menaquinone biosynthesis C-methylase UbiE